MYKRVPSIVNLNGAYATIDEAAMTIFERVEAQSVNDMAGENPKEKNK